jgi:predicted GNAT family N-acyltransferase
MVQVLLVANDEQLKACHEVRRVVFVEEQQVPVEEEWDDLDEVSEHFLALPEDGAPLSEALGTARLWIDPVSSQAKAQRVAVHKAARGKGIGRALMRALEWRAKERGAPEVLLGAQLTAIPFYERLGYTAYGPEFDDAGIPHRMMKLAL